MNVEPNIEIKPRYAIVCDDVRVEDNGKLILIGVYSDEILFPKFPMAISLAFWIEFESIGVGERQCEYRVVLNPGEVEITKIAGTFGSKKERGKGSFSFGGIGIQFQQPGSLSLQFRGDGKDWVELVSKNVLKFSDQPTASLPPALQSGSAPLEIT